MNKYLYDFFQRIADYFFNKAYPLVFIYRPNKEQKEQDKVNRIFNKIIDYLENK